MQLLNNQAEVYKFNFEFQKLLQKIDYKWENEDFVKNFDNLNNINYIFEIEFNNHKYIPLYISKTAKNEFNGKQVYFRLYSFEGNEKNKRKIPESLEELTVRNHIGRLYEFNLEEICEGIDDIVYEQDIAQEEFINQVKECYVESEYDHSNIDITEDGKNRIYYLLPHQLIKKLDIKYDYAGIYSDKIGIAAIQNPFKSSNSYVYIRKDIANKYYDSIIYGVYSEKMIKSKDLSTSLVLGSEYDAIYIYEKNNLLLYNLSKRPDRS